MTSVWVGGSETINELQQLLREKQVHKRRRAQRGHRKKGVVRVQARSDDGGTRVNVMGYTVDACREFMRQCHHESKGERDLSTECQRSQGDC
jgi:Na+-translocating ferredoxin:NAD+ oxidoreductase RNF subunit RnfB